MRFLLIFGVLLLSIFATAGFVAPPEQSPHNVEISIENPATLGTPKGVTPKTNATSGTTGSEVVAFAERFSLPHPAADLGPGADTTFLNACVPTQEPNVFGFYSLNDSKGDVDFNVYSRLLYYALTPGPLGNLKIPTRWKDESITQKAHQYGAKVDLVVRNIKWDASDKSGPPLREGEEKGLRLGKSFVVLNLVDEIVDAVNRFGFDGVVIDIKIPTDDEPRNVVPFFIKRLSDRLEKGNVNGRANDLLKATDKKLSVVITKNSDPFFIGTVVPSTYESVDFWLVDDEEFKAKVKKALSEEATKNTGLPRPKTALILLNTKRDKEDLTGTVVIWDVGNENGEEKWSSMLQNKIFGTDFNPKFQISRLVCSERATILLGLSVITPFLVLMLLLSWLIYDYPKFVKPAMATSALWGVLLIVVLAFLALLYSLPSLDPNHIGVYVILGSLVLPLVYIIWGVMSLLTKPRYP